MNIEQYMYYLLYALVYLVLATAMKYILNIRSSKHYDADDVIADGNLAVGLRRSGAQLGLAIAMLGYVGVQSSRHHERHDRHLYLWPSGHWFYGDIALVYR